MRLWQYRDFGFAHTHAIRALLMPQTSWFIVPGLLGVKMNHSVLVFFARTMLRAMVAAAALAAALICAHAQEARPLRGAAIVIGNSAYEHLSELANPANDARAVEMLLNALGFETEMSLDRDARRLARDLDIFLEDAEGADVAVVYYAGHGIEAGGENFLVPVDADISALDAAGEKLVPISAFLERLQAVVPVTIIMLDACRDNPFPADATVRFDATSEPIAMGEGGLGETRGAVRIAPAGTPDVDNFGSVVAFAAAPGHVALDGEAGSNSPYTAAVLRHLETMAGEEFGTVMRMVAEEVYLKTAGRQRPWVNESLRRLLYFGAAPEPVEGDEGRILTERRQLLITISALPAQGRSLVERVAGDRGVPMDGLFAMLDTLGEDLPDDPAELDRLLRRLADDLKGFLEERATLTSTDPEVLRLSELAERAAAEGALTTAVELYDQVKARFQESSETLDQAEDNLRQRRIERAEFYARSGEIRALALDRLGAAEDYVLAAREVERWDDDLNRRYRLAQARALTDHGIIRGDTPALQQAVAVLDALLEEGGGSEVRIALADALAELGKRQTTNEALERAVAAYREVLGGEETADRAAVTRKLGTTLLALGRRDIGGEKLQEAVAALEAALVLYPRDRTAAQWAAVQVDLGQAMSEMWNRDRTGDALDLAIERYQDALREFDPVGSPAAFASAQLGLGKALRLAGIRSVKGELPGNYFGFFADSSSQSTREAAELFRQSDASFEAALEVCGRETYPVCWAAAEHGRAVALYSLGSVELDDRDAAYGHFRRSMVAFESALGEQRFDMSPLDWAETYSSRAEMLQRFGLRSAMGVSLIYLAEAARGYQKALSVISAESLPAMWFDLGNRLAQVYGEMASRDGRKGEGIQHIKRKVEQLRTALLAIDRNEDRARWSAQMLLIAEELNLFGRIATEAASVQEAIAILTELGDTELRAEYTLDLANVLLERARSSDDPDLRGAARKAYEEAVEIAAETGKAELRARYARELGEGVLKLAEQAGDPLMAREARHILEKTWIDYYRHQSPGSSSRPLSSALRKAERALTSFETERLEGAAAGLRAELTPQLRQDDSQRWALAQYDLAAILRAIGEQTERTARFDEAATAYRSAIEIWTLDAEPLRYGLAQEQLGDTLKLASEKAGGAMSLLDQAVVAYEAALDGLSPELAHADHVLFRRDLAKLLVGSVGKPRQDNAALERAIAHYRAVLNVTDPDEDGFTVVLTQSDLGDTARLLAENGAGSQHLKDAADAYREASSVGREKLSQFMTEGLWWREHEQKIGHTLVDLGVAENDPSRYREALSHYEVALDEAAKVEDGRVDEAFVRSNYARALYLLGSAETDTGLLERSVEQLRLSMEVLDRDGYPDTWAWSNEYLGFALRALAESDSRRAGEAAAAFEEVRALRPRDTHPWLWAVATYNIAYAKTIEARANESASGFEEAVALAREAAPVFTENGSANSAAFAEAIECEGLAWLARSRSDAAQAGTAIEICEQAIPVLQEMGEASEQKRAEESRQAALAVVAESEGKGDRK